MFKFLHIFRTLRKNTKMKYYQILEIARKLRRNQTNAEQRLWQVLRNRNLDGKKFTRQHPIIYEFNKSELFFFIPDFYCAEYKLVIELDGEIHNYRKEHDMQRDLILSSLKLEVLRIKNEELENMDAVKNKIREHFI